MNTQTASRTLWLVLAAAAWGAAARAEEPIELKLKWPVGRRYVQRMEMTQTSEGRPAGVSPPANQEVKAILDFAISVLGDRPDGGRDLELEYLGVKMDLAGPVAMSFDSATDPKEDADNPLAATLRKAIGARVQYRVDARSRVEAIDGCEALTNRVLADAPPQAAAVAQGLFGEDALRQMGDRCIALGMPDKPVTTGDTWPVTREMPLTGLGTLTTDFRYTFKGRAAHGERVCAVLEYAGAMNLKPGAAPHPAGVTMSMRDGKSSGKTWFDPELGAAVDSTVDQEATLTMKPPDVGGARAQAVTTKLTLHLETRLVSVGAVSLGGGRRAVGPPRAEEIQSWIRDLGADAYTKRDAAMKKLEDAGEAAVPALKEAKSDDPEVRARVQALLHAADRSGPNEMNAGAGLKQLCTHEAVWRQGDYDRNGMLDYWTRDVAGFRCVRDAGGQPVALVDLALARADAAPATAYPELGGVRAPKRGYWFKALTTDQDGNPYVQQGLPVPTAGNVPAGVCTNQSRFAFCAFPARYGKDGRLTFLMSEDGVIWQKDLGPDAKGVDVWPNPEATGSGWSQFGG